jgi:hypothetical protein
MLKRKIRVRIDATVIICEGKGREGKGREDIS